MDPILDWFETHAFGVVVALLVFLALGGSAWWAQQSTLIVAGAENQANAQATRAVVAEMRAAQAEGSLTAIAVQAIAQQTRVAAATATAGANATATVQAINPRGSLERALELVFEAYKDPVEQKIRLLDTVLAPEALPVFRPELDRLLSLQGRLGGSSSYKVEVLSTNQNGPDRADIRTREEWVYDERSRSDQPIRCVREVSEQTYVMERTEQNWKVMAVQPGAVQRSTC